MKKERIGILTFWGVPNYGAFAQAYALNKLVSGLMPTADVAHIAYLHPKHIRLYKLKKRKYPSYAKWWYCFNPLYYLRILKCFISNHSLKRIPYFDNYWKLIPHVKVKNEKKLEKIRFQTIITGSDCIWEYSIDSFGDDAHLIGNNLNCENLVAYAPSFGDMNTFDTFPSFVSKGLNKYSYLSSRDTTTKDIINMFVNGVNVPMVLDPTLLYDFKKDIAIPSIEASNYILVYGKKFKESDIADIKRYAKDNKLGIIGAGFSPTWVDENKKTINPLEWISMFKNATLVVTCTFHGLMFAINFGKRVFFNQVDYVKNRSSFLLKELGLLDLFKGDCSLSTILSYDWNYDRINSKLASLRKESLRFLEDSLKYDK